MVDVESFIRNDKESEKSVGPLPNFVSTADVGRTPELSAQVSRSLAFSVVVVVTYVKYAIDVRRRIPQDTRNVIRVTQFTTGILQDPEVSFSPSSKLRCGSERTRWHFLSRR